MKISLAELKKTVQWVEGNTNAVDINLTIYDNRVIVKTTDKYDCEVEISLYDTETAVMPKIKKTELLR